MKRLARKYHRIIAPIIALPLVLTVLTGMLATVVREWPINTGLTSGLIVSIHTGELLHKRRFLLLSLQHLIVRLWWL